MADQRDELAQALLERDVANFLYHEAELLDERRPGPGAGHPETRARGRKPDVEVMCLDQLGPRPN